MKHYIFYYRGALLGEGVKPDGDYEIIDGIFHFHPIRDMTIIGHSMTIFEYQNTNLIRRIDFRLPSVTFPLDSIRGKEEYFKLEAFQ